MTNSNRAFTLEEAKSNSLKVYRSYKERQHNTYLMFVAQLKVKLAMIEVAFYMQQVKAHGGKVTF